MRSEGANHDSIALLEDPDVSRARVLVSRWATRLGFSIIDRTRAMTAVSEIARNCIVHGGGGLLKINELFESGRPGFCIRIVDKGTGIRDIEKALGRGFSTGSGLGLGLGGAKKLSKNFSIETTEDGTTVVLDYWK